jgi:hypothetical protein
MSLKYLGTTVYELVPPAAYWIQLSIDCTWIPVMTYWSTAILSGMKIVGKSPEKHRKSPVANLCHWNTLNMHERKELRYTNTACLEGSRGNKGGCVGCSVFCQLGITNTSMYGPRIAESQEPQFPGAAPWLVPGQCLLTKGTCKRLGRQKRRDIIQRWWEHMARCQIPGYLPRLYRPHTAHLLSKSFQQFMRICRNFLRLF